MAETKISKEQVEKISQLCNLKISEEEVNKYVDVLSDTLEYINVIEQLDTANTNETYQVTGLKNVFMSKDENKRTLTKKDALLNAKEVVRDLFTTEAVFDR